MSLSPSDLAKRAAALRAAELVEDGMRIGIGSGSTAAFFTRALAERVRAGLRVTGVPTSAATEALARELGVPLGDLDGKPLDLAIDGADEIDPVLDLIKGGGAALLREKIVAAASRRFVVIADAGKRVPRLGAFPLPVEINRFGWQATRAAVEAATGVPAAVRMIGGAALVTVEGHYLLDLRLGEIADAPDLAWRLESIPGLVDHGLFIGMSDSVILGRPDGTTELIRRIAPPAGIDVEEAMRDEDA